MKYILTLLSSAFIMQISFAQDDIRTKKLSFGLFASPDISYRNLAANTGSSGNIANTRDGYERIKLSFTAGAEAIYQISQRFSITGGMQYSVKGEKTVTMDFYYVDPVLGFVPPPPGEPTSGYFIYNTRYIDIPLRADYYFSRKKIAPFITAGVSTNIFINERVVAHKNYADGTTKKDANTGNNGYHRVNPQVQLGFGIDLETAQARMRILPIIRFSVAPVNKGSVDGYFHSFGLGLSYYFSK